MSLNRIILSFTLTATIIIAIYIRVVKKISIIHSKLNIILFAIYIYYLFRSLPNGISTLEYHFLEKNLAFLFFPIMIIPNVISNKTRIYKFFIYSFVIVSIYAIIRLIIENFINDTQLTKWYFQRFSQLSFHTTYIGLYAIIALNLILTNNKIFKNTLFVNSLIAFLIFLIFFSTSRIAIISLFIYTIINSIFFNNKKHRNIILILIFSFFLSFTVSSDFRYKIVQLKDFRGLSYFDNNNYGSVSLRVAKINAAYKVWKENFWFGTGFDKMQLELNKKYRSKNIQCWVCAKRNYNPHNQYLQILSTNGIIGFSFFILLSLYLIFVSMSNRNYQLLNLLLIIFLFSLTESILESIRGIVPLLFFVILLLNNHKFDK